MVTGNRKNRAHSGLWWWGGRVLHALDGIKGSFFLSFFFFFLNSDRWSRRIVGGTGKRKIDGGGRAVGFFEDFVERDRLLAIGWDCNAIEMRDERIWSGIIGDRGWIVVAVCSAGICSKYGEKGCLSLSWKLNCFRWALMENRPLPFQVFQRNLCKESHESDGWFCINGLVFSLCSFSNFVLCSFFFLTNVAHVSKK